VRQCTKQAGKVGTECIEFQIQLQQSLEVRIQTQQSESVIALISSVRWAATAEQATAADQEAAAEQVHRISNTTATTKHRSSNSNAAIELEYTTVHNAATMRQPNWQRVQGMHRVSNANAAIELEHTVHTAATLARAWQEHGNSMSRAWQEHGKNMTRA
jgi:hypothetical protein